MEEQSFTSEYRQAMLNEDCTIPSLRFPQKLWRIVNECKSGAIKWGINGISILINYTLFGQEYLQPDNSIFKTTNIASFIRQLNLYGFRKVSLHSRELVNTDNHDLHEFLHEHFRAGRLDLLSRVCRKTGVKKSLMRMKPITDLQPRNSEANYRLLCRANGLHGMTKLQKCQIALSKALEQATKQYHREKLWLQLAEDNICKNTCESHCQIEALEPNHIQIIFQDIYGKQEVKNLPIINIPSFESVESEEKIKIEDLVTFRSEDI
ncbi:heat shock transcription factor, X-linked member 4-like [Phymastichus coffea]|uniref:heat shock transcription factor, X-linked member 4-like n=1 Tax=Phymastichus coffea TaxID=108790 RepID=UPI00273B1290|nr:heat shock transcription factor, X-linked member 4-like [Phymastichus coffea]